MSKRRIPGINPTESDERSHLEFIKERLTYHIHYADRAANRFLQQIHEAKDYMWEQRDGMDRMKKNSVMVSISGTAATGRSVVKKRERLSRLRESPYFGRIDFRVKGDAESRPVYIGRNAFYDADASTLYIHDWRAPIAGLFYESMRGETSYQAPGGTITGDVTLKRQYRIRAGKLEFMLESDLNILDEVLQIELSRTSDVGMQSIVATIQHEQNAPGEPHLELLWQNHRRANCNIISEQLANQPYAQLQVNH